MAVHPRQLVDKPSVWPRRTCATATRWERSEHRGHGHRYCSLTCELGAAGPGRGVRSWTAIGASAAYPQARRPRGLPANAVVAAGSSGQNWGVTISLFRYRGVDDGLYVDGAEVPGIDSTEWFAPLELVAGGSLASLKRAFAAAANNHQLSTDGLDQWGLPAATAILQVSIASVADFDEDYSIAEAMQLGLVEGRLLIDIQTEMHGSELGEGEVGPFLRPLLERSGAAFVTSVFDGAGNQAYANTRVQLTRRGATVGDAIILADKVRTLLQSVVNRDLTAESALDLIGAGRADLLIGLPESSWLEAKSRLRHERGKEGSMR